MKRGERELVVKKGEKQRGIEDVREGRKRAQRRGERKGSGLTGEGVQQEGRTGTEGEGGS